MHCTSYTVPISNYTTLGITIIMSIAHTAQIYPHAGQMGKYQRFSAILKPGAARRLVGAKGIGKL